MRSRGSSEERQQGNRQLFCACREPCVARDVAEAIASAFIEGTRGEFIGERSFEAGSEQELFKVKRGNGLLLTTRKWASASGAPFLGSNRNNSGVKPSIEVESAEEEIDVEDLVDSQGEQQEQDAAVKPKPAQQEDLVLKKVIEIPFGKQ